ncbi:hypothetical protein MSG28_004081 [Choristoneura fumiferana]|uniref:Uncharacterized protein n=1 Tax=Choristoneura fumiferana TaxID=7141 RepID=A0ACC0KIB6_CHOFU|nr:hypothetical protein MSG28_004081 [Choristoneura fumiferana]
MGRFEIEKDSYLSKSFQDSQNYEPLRAACSHCPWSKSVKTAVLRIPKPSEYFPPNFSASNPPGMCTCCVTMNPESHPFISDQEKKFLEEALGRHRSSEPSSIPWKAIVIFAEVHDRVLKFDIHRTGMLAALPYLVMWICSIVFGWICDKIVKRKWMTVTNARKTFTTIWWPVHGIHGSDGSILPWDEGQRPRLELQLCWDHNGNRERTGCCYGDHCPVFGGTADTRLFIVTNLVYVAWASGDEQWWNSSSQDPRRRQKTEAGDSSRSVNAEAKTILKAFILRTSPLQTRLLRH